MIAVNNMEKTVDWYTRHFNYVEKKRESDRFTVVFLGPKDSPEEEATLELLYDPDGNPSTLGDAWGHLAVRTPDLGHACTRLRDGGIDVHFDEKPSNYDTPFVRDPNGYKIQLVENEYGSPWSLDHTMIRTQELDRALGWYVRRLGYEVVDYSEKDTSSHYFVEPGGTPDCAMSLEIVSDKSDSFELGDSWGHLSVRVSDLKEFWRELETKSTKGIRGPGSTKGPYAFVEDADGHVVELVE